MEQRCDIYLDSDTLSLIVVIFRQLYTATLDNTSNNDTTCRTIEDIHIRRGLEWNSDEQQLPFVCFSFPFLNLFCKPSSGMHESPFY